MNNPLLGHFHYGHEARPQEAMRAIQLPIAAVC